jgi:hypothetical protein
MRRVKARSDTARLVEFRLVRGEPVMSRFGGLCFGKSRSASRGESRCGLFRYVGSCPVAASQSCNVAESRGLAGHERCVPLRRARSGKLCNAEVRRGLSD